MSDFNYGNLELHLLDVLDQEIKDDVRITLDNFYLNSLDSRVNIKNSPVTLKLVASPQGTWTVYVQPTCYRALNVGEFVNIPPDQTVVHKRRLFLNSHSAKPIFPATSTIFSDVKWADLAKLLDDSTFSGKTGQALWESLAKSKPLLAASLLNLYARTKFVVLSSQKNVFSYFEKIVDIRQDRIFVLVDPALYTDVVNAESTTNLLKKASGLLHVFPTPYKKEDVQGHNSFKTPERTGNLQLTFAQAPDGKMMVDADVDDHSGIVHAFDVLKHTFTGEKTHPYDIHQILTYFYSAKYNNKIDLGYQLVPKKT